MKISIKIRNCRDCPYFKSERHYTPDSFEMAYDPDSFEMAYDWYCHHTPQKVKKIKGYVEWNEESKISIPEWCPAKIKS